jgi:hypothetical protein
MTNWVIRATGVDCGEIEEKNWIEEMELDLQKGFGDSHKAERSNVAGHRGGDRLLASRFKLDFA